jgi:uncharacterized protein YjbJ (UPF0337 family)
VSDRTRAEGTVDEVTGNVKQTVGKATGNERLEGEGKLDELKGDLKQGAADVKDKIEDVGREIKERI